MRIKLNRIVVNDFKRIQVLPLDLMPMTALVGGNASGKSSALQAAQLGISVLQASFKRKKDNGEFEFHSTVSNDLVLFRPTENLLNLRRLEPCTQKLGYEISYFCTDVETGEVKQVSVNILRGKNANIAIKIGGDNDLAGALADLDRPFSILTPGLSGIPLREEWRTRGSMDAAVMHGDANLYLRTVLDHLFSLSMTGPQKEAWKARRSIGALPDCQWKKFSLLVDRCYPGARVVVDHDHVRHRYVDVVFHYDDAVVTLDMASTGMLQVIQIIAYSCFYQPPLLLLDEPDAHLHADSQSKLYEALRSVAHESDTRVLFASHSPQLINRLMYDTDARLIWMQSGAEVEVEDGGRPAIPLLMELGALASGAEVFDPSKRLIILTEDKLSEPVLKLAEASGAVNNVACVSYNGCGNLNGARMLAKIITEMRDDVHVFIHRDRDFRTETEVNFEGKVFDSYARSEGMGRVYEIFTPHGFNDVEHVFSRKEHVANVFGDVLGDEEIDAIYSEALLVLRDELVKAARDARAVIEREVYNERKKRKPQWEEAGMNDRSPSVREFIPADGRCEVEFENCHGKILMRGLKRLLHDQIGGDTKDIERKIFQALGTVSLGEWEEAFSVCFESE